MTLTRSIHQSLNLLAALMALQLGGVASAAPAVPRPEHPRPDLCRENWLSLNGEWQFEIDKQADGESRGLTYGNNLNSKIIVPFCPESKLSGLEIPTTQHIQNVWYRRMFSVPAAMKDKRVRMHFGGVDYQAWIYINGQYAGMHVGENVEFDFDITPLLKEGSNEVVVKVLDDLWTGLQPCGKQCSADKSWGCFYTRTTGIWQPVWLEAVGSSFVEAISVVPDPDNSRVMIDAKINGSDKDLTLKVEAYAAGKLVGSELAKGPWQSRLVLNLKEKKLWEPGAPFLYDLRLTLYSGKEKIDEMTSYFGLRNIVIDGRKILINGKPVFQRLILDQGFYPEGLWTAPSDAALKHDIEMSMACGYNGARLHQKVFEPRFLYWADKLGYMVWGEYPGALSYHRPESFSPVVNEWTEILLRDRNHPSIIGWCPFNENGGTSEELQKMIWNITKAIDPTRPALETSGWTHMLPHPEVRDAHDYTGDPVRLRQKWQDYFTAPAGEPFPPNRYCEATGVKGDRGVPFMVSEIGGIGWATEGGWSYGNGPKTLDEFYTRYQGTIDALLDNPNLFGFCYTQLTDIEQERNGLFFYDRKPKFDVKKLHDITARSAAYERGEAVVGPPAPTKTIDAKWKVLIGALMDGPKSTPYHYTTDKPADEWISAGFDDKSWKSGLAPFGYWGKEIRTKWDTPEIYLRKTFEYDGATLKKAAVVISHNDRTEVYLNGQKILSVTGPKAYHLCVITDEIRAALKKGTNTLAVHSHESGKGQRVDLAILVE